MQHFPNYDFTSITTSNKAFEDLENHIQLLKNFVNDCNELNVEEFNVLESNIKWLKQFYDAAIRCLVNGN